MNTHTTAPQWFARFAGILYLVITVAAVFAHFTMPDALIVAGDPATTAANIINAPQQFRLSGVGGEMVVLISETVLLVLLYVLLKPVNATLSLLAAVARLMMTAIHGMNLIFYFTVILMLNSPALAAAFDPDQLNALVMLALDAHGYGFVIGIAFLVPHVFALGWLIYQSGYFPKVIGILFLIAGVGYFADSVAWLLLPNYTTTPVYFAVPIAVAELAFPLWLIIRGVNKARWQEKVEAAV